jgi:hypothetical protein
MSEGKTRTHGLSSSAGWALEALEPMIVLLAMTSAGAYQTTSYHRIGGAY